VAVEDVQAEEEGQDILEPEVQEAEALTSLKMGEETMIKRNHQQGQFWYQGKMVLPFVCNVGTVENGVMHPQTAQKGVGVGKDHSICRLGMVSDKMIVVFQLAGYF
jgi:hypothetical protein